ncbi:hypothetical protein [Albidovulum sp.]|uniref:hypothetical protein n=1 Tax=Albidovulum sp. TaxID=1872424 RepID=UPI0039B9147A
MTDPLTLLRRCLQHLFSELYAVVECNSEWMMTDSGEMRPEPGTMDSLAVAAARQLVALIREIEALAGRDRPPADDWLQDVIDGRGGWQHLVGEAA